MPATYPLYEVTADAKTGEWLGEPRDMCHDVNAAEWHAKRDTDLCHYDTYEHFDGPDDFRGTTRAICVLWVES